MGLAIECWKATKAVKFEVNRNSWIPISFSDRESYKSETKKYDEIAMRYLSYVM